MTSLLRAVKNQFSKWDQDIYYSSRIGPYYAVAKTSISLIPTVVKSIDWRKMGVGVSLASIQALATNALVNTEHRIFNQNKEDETSLSLSKTCVFVAVSVCVPVLAKKVNGWILNYNNSYPSTTQKYLAEKGSCVVSGAITTASAHLLLKNVFQISASSTLIPYIAANTFFALAIDLSKSYLSRKTKVNYLIIQGLFLIQFPIHQLYSRMLRDCPAMLIPALATAIFIKSQSPSGGKSKPLNAPLDDFYGPFVRTMHNLSIATRPGLAGDCLSLPLCNAISSVSGDMTKTFKKEYKPYSPKSSA